ncbi:hypothetical protein [Hydrogenophaga sp. T2]|uniref:hypothetical protein n=1 Tax=Hydrogenophaga sp. T2 TaxID=3132823 RepID=UPI003CEC8F1E
MNTPTLPWRQRLFARFDTQALRDIAAAPAATGAEPAGLREALQRWSHAGLGSGRAPWWRPHALPEVALRFGCAALVAPGPGPALHACQRFARDLDRNDELAALAARSRWAGLRLKLAVKWHELWWWRARHPRQPWDCGELRDAPEALRRFVPRRPTLLLAVGLAPDRLRETAALLQARSAAYPQPVRLLCLVHDAADAPPGAALIGAQAAAR